MAAETGQGYLSKVVRSGARPFFAPARRVGRVSYAAHAPEAAAHGLDREATHGVAEPSESSAHAAPPTPHVSHVSHVTNGSLTSPAPSESSGPVPAAAFDEGSAARPPSEPGGGTQTSVEASVEARRVGETQLSERELKGEPGEMTLRPGVQGDAPVKGRSLDTPVSSDVTSGVEDVESVGVNRPRGRAVATGDAASAESGAGTDGGDTEGDEGATIRPAPPRSASLSSGDETSRTHVPTPEGGGSEGLESLRREESARQRAELGLRQKDGAHAGAPAENRAEEPGRQGETGTRDEDARRDAAAPAVPLLQHTRGETIVRLPRLSGGAAGDSRREKRRGGVADTRRDMQDVGANVPDAAGASKAAGEQARPGGATLQTDAGGTTPESSPGGGASSPTVNTDGISGLSPAGSAEMHPAVGPSLRPGAVAGTSSTTREKISDHTADAPATHPKLRASESAQSAQNALSSPASKSSIPSGGKGDAPGQPTRPGEPDRAGALSPSTPAPRVAGASASASRDTDAHPARTHARTAAHARTEISPARTDASALAGSRAGDVDGREAGALVPAESKRMRGGEAKEGRESRAGGDAPRVTVNRLDVRIVDQTPPPPAPAPAPRRPAPAPKRDGWEPLDRGHRGRLFLL